MTHGQAPGILTVTYHDTRVCLHGALVVLLGKVARAQSAVRLAICAVQ
jgi:hypothetical protein